MKIRVVTFVVTCRHWSLSRVVPRNCSDMIICYIVKPLPPIDFPFSSTIHCDLLDSLGYVFVGSGVSVSLEPPLHCYGNCSKCFTLYSVADKTLYTLLRGRQNALRFTPWQTKRFTLYSVADKVLYTLLRGRQNALLFTPWQTKCFTLYSVADKVLYTLLRGRQNALLFTPWQIKCFTLYSVADKTLYSLLRGRSVQANNVSTFLGSNHSRVLGVIENSLVYNNIYKLVSKHFFSSTCNVHAVLVYNAHICASLQTPLR